MRKLACVISCALFALPLHAGEAIVAVGGSDFSIDAARASGVAEVSYRFNTDTPVQPHAVLAPHEGGFGYLGAGVIGQTTFNGPWFAEAGAGVGALIDTRDGTSADPALRISVALGRDFGKGVKASVGLARVVSDDITVDSAVFRIHLDM